LALAAYSLQPLAGDLCFVLGDARRGLRLGQRALLVAHLLACPEQTNLTPPGLSYWQSGLNYPPCQWKENPMTVSAVLDSAGRRRSPATLPGFHARRPPRNKGMLYPADRPTVEEIVCVMRHASDDPNGVRLRAMIVMPWRGGLRVTEALALSERDLDPERGSVLVRCGKGGRRREVGMDGWGWENLRPWLSERVEMPVGPLFCVIDGPTCGRPWSAAAVRGEFRRHATEAGVRRRFAPHQLRHAPR
jgi:integrase